MEMLAPFTRQLEKRANETVLMGQLAECLDKLFRDPRTPGLNVEQLRNTGKVPVLSARITRSARLIFVPRERDTVGLLHFDNHDEAYAWVDRNERQIPTMLTPVRTYQRGVPLASQLGPMPVVRSSEDTALIFQSAEEFRRMLEGGILRYLAYLDDEQRALAELNASGLLLVKGGAGTGKTAVAVHRVLHLVRQQTLLGPREVLYLCFNSVLASTVQQMLTTLNSGSMPLNVQVRTFHRWCLDLLRPHGVQAPDDAQRDRCRQAVYAAYGRLAPERKAALGEGLNGRFLAEEITLVIKHNGLATREAYLEFNRRGRRVSLKRAQREVVWEVYEAAEQACRASGAYDWDDVLLKALAVLDASQQRPRYRAVVVDEGQDCSPVMLRLARRLLERPDGPLTVFADPAQAIYDNGFQWAQHELRPAGGNVRWLRTSYRCTREIHALARPLLDESGDLAEELRQLQVPTRSGPRPQLLVADDSAGLLAEVARQVRDEVERRPAGQVAVLVPSRQQVRAVVAALNAEEVPCRVVERGQAALHEPTVKVLTLHSAKGLDFPCVYLLAEAPTGRQVEDPSGPAERRTLYVGLTRASERLVVATTYDRPHPLLDCLPVAAYEPAGPRGAAFANTRPLRQRPV